MQNIESKVNWFEFTVNGGETVYRLPLLQDLPADKGLEIGRLFDGERDAVRAYEWQLALIEEYCPGLKSEISLASVNQILRLWQQASTVTVGESQASPESS